MAKKNIKAQPFAFPTPVYIVGTYSEDKVPNAMNVAWGGVTSSSPPTLSISLRAVRQTYKNILKTKSFTVNLANETLIKESDYFGLISGAKEDKFAKTNLTPIQSDFVNAPYIEEFPISIECEVVDIVEIGSHFQVIGKIVNIIVDEELLDEAGEISIEKANLLLFEPISNNYFSTGEIAGKAFNIGKEFLIK